MILLAVLLLQSTPAEIAAWDGLPIPDAVGEPAARYIGCIGDPVLDAMESGDPADPAARQKMLDETLAACRTMRADVAAEMEAKLANTRGWTDVAVRHAKVERLLTAAEERVGYTATNPEGFQKVVECINAGRQDCERLLPPEHH